MSGEETALPRAWGKVIGSGGEEADHGQHSAVVVGV
jgi:hypothetical protein